MSKGSLSIEADIQHVGALVGRKFSDQFELWTATDPAGCAHDRVPHDFAGGVEQQAAGNDTIVRQGILELPAGLLGTLQPQQREHDERCHIGIWGEADGPLEQAQRGILVAGFEHEQAAVNRRQQCGLIGLATPCPVQVAQGIIERIGAQGAANLPQGPPRRRDGDAPQALVDLLR